MVENSEFLDRMKQAMDAREVEAPPPGVVERDAEPSPRSDAPQAEVDVKALAAIVAAQQSVEPRTARVAVPSGAWNTLAAHTVRSGLRRTDTEGRSRLMFDTAVIEPTHLTPVAMTAAATLALRTGEVAPWRSRATGLHHDPRAIPGLDKAGVMIGVAFTGRGRPRVEATDDPDHFLLSNIELITHSHLYDALLVRVPEPSSGATCYLLPIHTGPGQPNRVRVKKLFGRPGTAPASFARVQIDGAVAVRVGPRGAGDQLFRPVIERLRADAAIVGAAQMRAAVDVMTEGLERRTGADIFHRQFVEDVEATVAEGLAIEAADRLAEGGVGGLNLVLAQHWVQSRFGAIVPDASAMMHLASVPVDPAVAWTSPLLPLWGGTAHVLRSEFVAWADRGALDSLFQRCGFESHSKVITKACTWLLEMAMDRAIPAAERMEAAALVSAASILAAAGRTDALAVLLGSDSGPGPRASGSTAEQPDGSRAGDRDVVVDLREQGAPVAARVD